MHKMLKKRNYKYLVKIYWIPSELKYRNIKFIYNWYRAQRNRPLHLHAVEPKNLAITINVPLGSCQ